MKQLKRKPRGMDVVEWRMCRRKKRYLRKSEAETVAAKSGVVLRPYECLLCHYWHLTSRPDRAFASEWLMGRYS